MRATVLLGVLGLAAAVVLAGQLKAGADGVAGGCTPGTGPDVIVGHLDGIARYGAVNGISGYALGTTSCNIGSQVLQWQGATNHHPVIAQNLYRLHDGRFEQLGMSWVKHGFSADTQNLCCTCINPSNFQLLGIGCSDAYGSFLNGDQAGFTGGCGITCGGLGPHFEVNPTTGVFAWPYFAAGVSGDALYKRLQVQDDDLDPALHPGAKYYGEGQYVTPEDAAAANHHNSVSYREVVVGIFYLGSWIIDFTGTTTTQLPAIYAWRDNDPQVVINTIEDDGGAADAHDGRYRLGYRATDNGDGTWHYEYALYNMNSHRSARSFSLPVPPGVAISNAGFHDVDYHSGDGDGGVNYDGTDWDFTFAGGKATWSTQTFAQNQSANALRWGTLYNFRFDADSPPAAATAAIGLFRPGTPTEVSTATLGPSAVPCPWDCGNDDGNVAILDFLAVLVQWGSSLTSCDLGLGNAEVGIDEFLDLLAHWGACP